MTENYERVEVIKKSALIFMFLSIFFVTNFTFLNKMVKAEESNDEIVCSATAYTASTGSLTASGKKVERNPNGISTVAVDPRIIPIGTYLYIEGYGYAIAADTGSAIKGKKIDVYFKSSSECYTWGRKNVKVRILGNSINP